MAMYNILSHRHTIIYLSRLSFPLPNLSPYLICHLNPVLKLHLGSQKPAIDHLLYSFPRTSKNCKGDQLTCSISTFTGVTTQLEAATEVG